MDLEVVKFFQQDIVGDIKLSNPWTISFSVQIVGGGGSKNILKFLYHGDHAYSPFLSVYDKKITLHLEYANITIQSDSLAETNAIYDFHNSISVLFCLFLQFFFHNLRFRTIQWELC